MAIGDDFTISANGDIRYIGYDEDDWDKCFGLKKYTVDEFHNWLLSKYFDNDDLEKLELGQFDFKDDLDIYNQLANPATIRLCEPWNIDDSTAQHLYNGTIIQDGGDTIYDGLVSIP